MNKSGIEILLIVIAVWICLYAGMVMVKNYEHHEGITWVVMEIKAYRLGKEISSQQDTVSLNSFNSYKKYPFNSTHGYKYVLIDTVR